MGTLGYLTEIELSHLDDALDQIIKEHCMFEERMMVGRDL